MSEHTNINKRKIMANQKIVQAYLNFDGKCEEALAFYGKALGAKTEMLLRFKDSPEPPPPGCGPSDNNKVMHAQFRVGDTVLMAADGRGSGKPTFQGISLALTLPSEAEVDRAFNALAEGGQVQMPLAKTFFSPRFGMVTDRYGIMWMILAEAAPQKS